MERCWFGFLLGGILVQGSVGHAGETAQAKIKRALFSICMERMVGPNGFETIDLFRVKNEVNHLNPSSSLVFRTVEAWKKPENP